MLAGLGLFDLFLRYILDSSDPKIMIKIFGHTDYKLILSTYFGQNHDPRLVAEASKIDFGLDCQKPSE